MPLPTPLPTAIGSVCLPLPQFSKTGFPPATASTGPLVTRGPGICAALLGHASGVYLLATVRLPTATEHSVYAVLLDGNLKDIYVFEGLRGTPLKRTDWLVVPLPLQSGCAQLEWRGDNADRDYWFRYLAGPAGSDGTVYQIVMDSFGSRFGVLVGP